MPDLKGAAEAGSNMNGCLIWVFIGFFVFIGVSSGSMYMVFMALVVGGAMLGGNAMKGKQEKASVNSRTNQTQKDLPYVNRKERINSPLSSPGRSQASTYSKSENTPASSNNFLPSNSRGSRSEQHINTTPSNQVQDSDLVNELEKLADLKLNGYITDQEFNILKSKALSQSVNQTVEGSVDCLEGNSANNLVEKTDIVQKKPFTPDDLI